MMNESKSQPALTLGEPPGRLAHRTTDRMHGRMRALLLLQIITLIAIGIGILRPPSESGPASRPERIEEVRSTAIALEDRGLASEAATVWRDYLRLSPNAKDRTEVLYRIGRLKMKAQDYGLAMIALIEAEQRIGEDDNLQPKIGPRIVECLRRMGRYGEIGRELSRQVEIDADPSGRGPILATFAGEQFTQADLDRMIERTVDRILAMQPGHSFRPAREQLLKHYESAEARQRVFQEILQRELFSRRAREMKIDREENFLQSQEFLQTELLASLYLSHEMQKINPTDIDIESHYTAHQADYQQAESVWVVVLSLKDDQSSEEVLQKIGSADDFRRLVKEFHGGENVTPVQCVRGRVHPRLGETEALFELTAGEWTHSTSEGPQGKWLALVESVSPASTPPLGQIRSRVEADYRTKKQQELTQQLLEDLTSRYNVKILATPNDNASEKRASEKGASEKEGSVKGRASTQEPADSEAQP